ncbi:chromosome segregation ATPase [Catenulispora sp. GP43]|uniref:hypothetical protein n=1 Tax=Catenulispora sp. GP43 TaxID=3156263 RepID=UPI0035148E31
MRLISRIAGRHRPKRSGRQKDPAPDTARWRQRAMLTSLRRDLDEAADELAFVEVEITRSREHAARLAAEEEAAAADGCAAVAAEIHEELSQTRAFLAELVEVHDAVIAEQDRLSSEYARLVNRLAEADRTNGPITIITNPGTPGPTA